MKFKALPITLFFASFFVAGNTAFGQSQFSAWQTGFFTLKLNNKFSIHFDEQVWSGAQLKQVQNILLRPGLNWNAGKNVVVTAGYLYFINRWTVSDVSDYAGEHRLWEQVVIKQPVGFTSIAHRFRLEQRFLPTLYVDGDKLKKNGHRYSNRFRYFARTMLPFSGEKGFTRGPYGAIQDEVFLNFGDKSAVNGKTFDQNWAYGAVGYRFSAHVDVETGYLNQYISRAGDAHLTNHVLQVATYIRL